MSISVIAKIRAFCGLIALVVVSACASPVPPTQVFDPLERQNRAVHAFNKGLDRGLLRPGGSATQSVPDEITQPVSNFADNVGLPGAVANGLLQGNIAGASTNLFRFMINSTVGIAGLLDPAGAIGLAEEPTDFGETLYVWGVPEGAYLELPLLGPTTERRLIGRVVDSVFDPLDSVGLRVQREYGTYARVADIAISRGARMDTFDGILHDSADSYAQVRLAYLQNRRFELGQSQAANDDIDPFATDLDVGGFE